MSNQSTDKDSVRDQFDKYLNNKKWFLLSLVFFFALAFLYLRYSTNQYTTKANIKIANNDKNKGLLSEINKVNEYGFFNKDFNSVDDEIEVLKSKTLITAVSDKLNLNVQYFIQGKIKALEIYENPPITINFLANDSIIETIDTTMTLHVASKSQFIFKNSD